ncbi:unnamed protein product [Pieris macdunnoughi]|uniref:Bro-N domain-containing protein n=1 Tax=Pieris macdunnoughi TaxID=345717 RepID=A0A821XPL2_9NEOP|nr:unnamed protein product [Pieris macdunnoughi]
MSLQRFNFPLAKLGDEDSDFKCWAYVTKDNNIYCKLKEFALLLGYENVKKAYRIVPDEWKCSWKKLDTITAHLETPPNWHPETLFVSKPGIYALFFVFEEVLPTIRKTGAYVSLQIGQNQISELLSLIIDKDKQMAKLIEKIIDVRPKLAVMTERDETKHHLHVYKRDDCYKSQVDTPPATSLSSNGQIFQMESMFLIAPRNCSSVTRTNLVITIFEPT